MRDQVGADLLPIKAFAAEVQTTAYLDCVRAEPCNGSEGVTLQEGALVKLFHERRTCRYKSEGINSVRV